MRHSNYRHLIELSLCAVWLLSACSGGGSSSSSMYYTISGTVSGLNPGARVTVQDNGSDPTTVTANGSFSFATPVPYKGAYAVTVATQPLAQTCKVTAGIGSGVSTNVSGISVRCGPATESVIHPFGAYTDGWHPAGIIQGSDGNFYGTTQLGGTSNIGTVFKITPAGVETVLHSFAGGTTDGSNPNALIEGSDGNFYGTTPSGGTGGYGTVFKITPAGVETVLHSFAGGTTDGSNPSALIQGRDGNFYGITGGGGTSNNGTVFKITPAGVETVFYSFAGGTTDGAYPSSALIQGSDGNFYGTTYQGGNAGAGTVFRITSTGVEAVLHSFAEYTDGINPNALIEGSDGNFYGTTEGGPHPSPLCTVFKITPAGVETVLYSWDSGNRPTALIQAGDGNFYGIMTNGGGAPNAGSIFRVTPAGVETVLYSFTGAADGGDPDALIQGSDGNFYGTTYDGGTNGTGAVFKITPAGVETVLYPFAGAPGINPTGLIQGSDGNFYGTTYQGGTANAGSIFMITPAGVETMLYSFAGGTDGSNPTALIQGSDGNFYGTTDGGATCCGTVFKITPAGVETVLHSFAGGTDGSNPTALIQGSDGNFYGTTNGGATSSGTVFKITPAGVETVLHSFAANGTDGVVPTALIHGSDGNFYGTTAGGPSGNGTVFKITPAGIETVLHSFAANGTDGVEPTVLIQGSDGNFYGTTNRGGSSGNGIVFKITPAGVETVLHSFAGGATAASARNALIEGSDGNFYGTTWQGGTANAGTIFMITPAGVETVLYSFAGGTTDGSDPTALIQGSDGNFYGTTFTGGAYGLGTLFKF
jgi:uncharacterized repeat protein (TIGR03803 family)